MKTDTLMRYVCDSCGTRFTAGGVCATCCDTPLQDLSDPGVRSWLNSLDSRRGRQQLSGILLASPVLALPAPVFALSQAEVAGLQPVFLWMAAALTLALLLSRLFPVRTVAPVLTDTEERTLHELYLQRRRYRTLL